MESLTQALKDVHNKILHHLLTQNEPSATEYGDCEYRGSNGKKCAVGCLISDENYDPEFENWTIVNSTNKDILGAVKQSIGWAFDDEPLRRLLLSWQLAHDNYLGLTTWGEYIHSKSNEILNKFNLN